MTCACKGKPKCADGKRAWYLKMVKAKMDKATRKIKKVY
jgi:hypothetical protein